MASITSTSSSSHSSAALLDHLARLSRAHTEATLAPLGLRPRHLVALTVLREHAPATQSALSTVLAIDRTNLVGLLNELESDGLIARRRAEEDRRRHIVELTPAGEELLDGAECAIEAAEAELLSGLTEQERLTLYELLQRATAGHVVDCVDAAGLRGDPDAARDGEIAAARA